MDPVVNKEERMWAMLAHLSALCGHFVVIPFGHIIGPLVIWLWKRDQFPLVNDQGKEALNFQISLTIYLIVSAVLFFFLIGFIIFPVVWLAGVILTIIAGVKANEGIAYRYPATIRFV